MQTPEQWIFTGIVAILVAALSVVGTIIANRHQRGTPEHKLIDQLQEEMTALRKDVETLKTEQLESSKREREASARERGLDAQLTAAVRTTEHLRRSNERLRAGYDAVWMHNTELALHIERELGPPVPYGPPRLNEPEVPALIITGE